MAEDKLNDGSEEEKKSSNDMSDDDFGLPDLEFDELQELDMSFDDDEESDDSPVQEEPTPSDSPLSGSDDIDMSVLDDIPTPGIDEPSADAGLSNSILDEGIDEVEDVLDSAQLISDRLGDDDDDDSSSTDFGSINYDELIGEDSSSEPESSTEDSSDSIFASDSETDSLFGDDDTSDDDIMSSDDLLASIDSPDDLAALGMADDEEEDTDSLFASDDPSSVDFGSSSDEESLFDSDSISFGSSEEEEPITNDTEDKKLPENYKAYTYNESSGGFTKIIVIGVIVIAVIAAGMLWLSGGPEENKEVAKVEKSKPEPKKEEPAPVAEIEEPESEVTETTKPEEPVEETTSTASANAAPAGEIIRVTDRTGLSYIIIGSFIDEDLAMDYAKELSEQGRGVKIISPFGKSKRYRLSIADYSTYGDAASQLGQYQSEFGDQVWALKY
ncbi:SPOR domain-containing protein [Reichenbachiella ulvae]|uniref:SPOR domain-containing protein n=1 Tax=Reichenbachiella ulvae TaxID=2980104 RepID=A0ABT3CRI1_9BACT|nr:SPOR domain-containing protein [Reichenbachiella ulvae]MCV9386153.1 SPOR domain-containing protein [Reichenbachiella ulvae]